MDGAKPLPRCRARSPAGWRAAPSWVWAKPRRNDSVFASSKNWRTALPSRQMVVTCGCALHADGCNSNHIFPKQGFRLCGGDQRAMKPTKWAIALWKPSQPHFSLFVEAGALCARSACFPFVHTLTLACAGYIILWYPLRSPGRRRQNG